jgi:hypothetical protein
MRLASFNLTLNQQGTRPAAKRIEHGEAALAGLKASILRLYGTSEKDMTQDVLW